MKAYLLDTLLMVSVLLMAWAPAEAKPPVATIYLVRHAEKVPTPGLADPPLTPAGEARAQLLAKRLARRQPAALFTTDTHRARATLAPLAQATNLVPLVYNAQDPNGFAIQLYKEYAGRTVVVVGHSNTLLPLLAALGVTAPMQEIKEEEFDYLFKVELRPNQPARLAVSRYGAAPATVGSVR